MQGEWDKKEPVPQSATEALLTNGHTHLVNGALKSEDSSSETEKLSVDKELRRYRAKSTVNKPQSPSVEIQAKPDPYEFPHSPPKPDPSSANPVRCGSHLGQKDSPTTSPSSCQAKAGENHLLIKHLQSPCGASSDPRQSPLSLAPCSVPSSPLRLNGSHHSTFASDPASLNTSSVNVRLGSPSEKPSPAKSPAQLLEQTGGLISEYYSHSRLHQISTWRTGFSEYVNELHCKRKAAGAASFPGKDRLRKSVAQHSADNEGKEKQVTFFITLKLHSCKIDPLNTKLDGIAARVVPRQSVALLCLCILHCLPKAVNEGLTLPLCIARYDRTHKC